MVVDGDVRGDSLNEQVLDVTKEEKVNTEETPVDVKTDRRAKGIPMKSARNMFMDIYKETLLWIAKFICCDRRKSRYNFC